MCSVVGAILDNPSSEDVNTLKQVFLESEIRGKHASGLVWFSDKLNLVREPICISELLKKFDLNNTIYHNKIRLIGHIRYSTSDLKYNQPIGNDEEGYIVHNGVISQVDSKKWKDLYGYDCKTKNDSELLFHSLINKKNYNKEFPGCSVSALTIDKEGNIKNFRNSLRPQWKGFISSGVIIASTKNILLRSGITKVEKVISSDYKESIYRNLDIV